MCGTSCLCSPWMANPASCWERGSSTSLNLIRSQNQFHNRQNQSTELSLHPLFFLEHSPGSWGSHSLCSTQSPPAALSYAFLGPAEQAQLGSSPPASESHTLRGGAPISRPEPILSSLNPSGAPIACGTVQIPYWYEDPCPSPADTSSCRCPELFGAPRMGLVHHTVPSVFFLIFPVWKFLSCSPRLITIAMLTVRSSPTTFLCFLSPQTSSVPRSTLGYVHQHTCQFFLSPAPLPPRL